MRNDYSSEVTLRVISVLIVGFSCIAVWLISLGLPAPVNIVTAIITAFLLALGLYFVLVDKERPILHAFTTLAFLVVTLVFMNRLPDFEIYTMVMVVILGYLTHTVLKVVKNENIENINNVVGFVLIIGASIVAFFAAASGLPDTEIEIIPGVTARTTPLAQGVSGIIVLLFYGVVFASLEFLARRKMPYLHASLTVVFLVINHYSISALPLYAQLIFVMMALPALMIHTAVFLAYKAVAYG